MVEAAARVPSPLVDDVRGQSREPALLAEVVRSGLVESRHRGSVVAVDAVGEVLFAHGDTTSVMYPRSCNKLLQAAAMVRLGLDLPADLLALACASHSGEPFQVDGVRRILAGAGLDETTLQTPPDWPLDDTARDDVVRLGGRRAPVLMNCSGKHAAMLATCALRGWDTGTYLDPTHPLQAAIALAFVELTGDPVGAVGVDGCGAPLLGTSLCALARGFGQVQTAAAGTAEARVAAAVREYPEHVSGTRRDEARLLRALPGTIGKAGAEGCYAVALPDGRAVAVKIDDGSPRARRVVMAAALRALGVDAAVLDELGSVPVLGGARRVGRIRATLPT
ncbi:MAG: asparaginase [Nocardioidaceae bacterium]|jgi:L-asparaginase II|nr:asparaginase [Nocardioidaceae bacterium]